VSDILRAHLPACARIFAFGSRASAAQAKPCSDLDLLIDAGRPLSLDETAVLAEAFSESDLPFKGRPSPIGTASRTGYCGSSSAMARS